MSFALPQPRIRFRPTSGIRCQVLGDYLEAGLGDIPGISAEVWVETADLARAEAFLRQHRDRSQESAQPEENP